MKETSLWWLLVPVALVLGLLGVLLVTLVLPLGDTEQQCYPNAVVLAAPTSLPLVTRALDDLLEEGVISSVESAVTVLSRVAWVIDSNDEYRLEYWLYFGEGRSSNTVGFALICLDPELEVVWEYDGVQAPNE